MYLNGGLTVGTMVNATTGSLTTSVTTFGTLPFLQNGYKQVFFTNNAAYRQSATFDDNVPSAANLGLVFNFGAGGGTLDVPSGVILTINDGTTAGTGLTAAELQGSGDLTKVNTGTLILGGAATNFSNFTGQIFVNAGLLQIGGAGLNPSLGSTSAATFVGTGGGGGCRRSAEYRGRAFRHQGHRPGGDAGGRHHQ